MVRTRRLLAAGCLAVAALLLAGCANEYPNTVFNHTSDLNIAIDHLFDRMFLLGTIVFIGVEAALIYTVIKFRRREGGQEPRHVHGNTTIEILWTVIPAVILVFLAVPTVRTSDPPRVSGLMRNSAKNAGPSADLMEKPPGSVVAGLAWPLPAASRAPGPRRPWS